MSNLLETLLIEIGLDPDKFLGGMAQTLEASKKGKEAILKDANKIEQAQNKAADAVNKLKREVQGFLSIIAGGYSAAAIANFVTNLANADAAAGRLAANIGMLPEKLQAYGLAAERMGGDKNAAMNSVRNVRDMITRTETGGQLPLSFFQLGSQGLGGGSIPYGAGVSFENQTMPKIAEALYNMANGNAALGVAANRPRASQYGRDLGMDDNFVNLLMKEGRPGWEKLEKLSKTLVAKKEDIEAAEQLQEAWWTLKQTVTRLMTIISTKLNPLFTGVLKFLTDVFVALGGLETPKEREEYNKLRDEQYKREHPDGPPLAPSKIFPELFGGNTSGGAGADAPQVSQPSDSAGGSPPAATVAPAESPPPSAPSSSSSPTGAPAPSGGNQPKMQDRLLPEQKRAPGVWNWFKRRLNTGGYESTAPQGEQPKTLDISPKDFESQAPSGASGSGPKTQDRLPEGATGSAGNSSAWDPFIGSKDVKRGGDLPSQYDAFMKDLGNQGIKDVPSLGSPSSRSPIRRYMERRRSAENIGAWHAAMASAGPGGASLSAARSAAVGNMTTNQSSMNILGPIQFHGVGDDPRGLSPIVRPALKRQSYGYCSNQGAC
jgi:hypothetical protein